ncbi:o-succinylbenzoate--CoA ligase [Moritella marina ATCC 15381]|uniref:O-succinylbenzoate--CoA ligase n=1 Tax=Moritella marina ATCC 15381 TaxID=1202962 RepID=A0A5J6WJA0_MORMI|nr:o-succinylbenzoate--CoA ligase [Moritella marina]QFI38113.1 o-succinylbenzoate--CoA ligase [Moritella marina ATCC 15381]
MNNDTMSNNMATNHNVNFSDWPWLHWTDRRPEHIALAYGEQQFTWLQVNDRVNAYAKQLTEQGVRESDLIVAVSANNLTVLWLYLASLRLGACCVILDPKQSGEQLNDKLETLAAKFIWLSEADLNIFADLPHEGAQQLVFTYNEKSLIAEPFTVIVCTQSGVEWQAKRLASIVFTSGSSGKAKAVAHNAENHLYSAAGLLQSFAYTAQDNWLLSLPLFHVSGLAIVWRWLFAGGQLTLPATSNVIEQLSTVTHASLVPTQLKRYLHERDISTDQHAIRLKRILLGGAVIPVVLTDKAKSLGIDCWSGYGMTEMASTVTAKPADNSAGVGLLLAHRALEIDGQSIKVRGASLGMGYYYRGTLRSMTDDNGWLVTGDLGEIKCAEALVDTSVDKSWSELFILGRSDNMFISGGENIHPEHIERILLSHPLINQALVFPREDAEFGHRPIAVIDAMSHISVCEMNNYLQYKLAKFMWPLNYYTLPNNINVSGIKLNRASVQIWFASLSK